MLEQYLLLQVTDQQGAMMFEQNGTPPYWSNDIWEILNRYFPERRIGLD